MSPTGSRFIHIQRSHINGVIRNGAASISGNMCRRSRSSRTCISMFTASAASRQSDPPAATTLTGGSSSAASVRDQECRSESTPMSPSQFANTINSKSCIAASTTNGARFHDAWLRPIHDAVANDPNKLLALPQRSLHRRSRRYDRQLLRRPPCEVRSHDERERGRESRVESARPQRVRLATLAPRRSTLKFPLAPRSSLLAPPSPSSSCWSRS